MNKNYKLVGLEEEIIKKYQSGATIVEVAKFYNVTPNSIAYHLNKNLFAQLV